mmetsp:Transcript_24626/g.45558  ORF Transcript_24626/g.45558 Transcript_24626/m.45558 type:complete len:202 (-) Transcript_24626:386-991(-)|eukprot:CAMPEP_0197442794 /NCGR_PEP_ID=MMETSP1175-20131217/8732_1 /TAXON_ID=1003142 /ORGANISM="Triceratium dubium, Strain CCMP147" /LENGTH=201 /DNA_ID=CAMNT_0042973335 /DNA_START=529 /DNA_END=1134 /DNA_ORIENTATION=+
MRTEQKLLFLASLCSLVTSSQSLSIGNGASQPKRPVLHSESYAHQSAKDAGIHIGHASKEKGLGAFSTSPIPSFTFVGKYTGETLTLAEVQARYWGKLELSESDLRWMRSRRERNQGLTGHYIFEMADGTFIDAEDGDKSGWCRYMNHAKEGTTECNVKAFNQQTVGGDFTIPYFYAIRDIEAGEELCYDYGEHSRGGSMA